MITDMDIQNLNKILSNIDKQVSNILLKSVDKYTKLFIVNNCKKYYNDIQFNHIDEICNNSVDEMYNNIIMNNLSKINKLTEILELFYEKVQDTSEHYFDKQEVYHCNVMGCRNINRMNQYTRKYINSEEFITVRDILINGVFTIHFSDKHNFSFNYSDYKTHFGDVFILKNNTIIPDYYAEKNTCDYEDFRHSADRIIKTELFKINDDIEMMKLTPEIMVLAFIKMGYKYKTYYCDVHKKMEIIFDCKKRFVEPNELEEYIEKNNDLSNKLSKNEYLFK